MGQRFGWGLLVTSEVSETDDPLRLVIIFYSDLGRTHDLSGPIRWKFLSCDLHLESSTDSQIIQQRYCTPKPFLSVTFSDSQWQQ